jgi:hypothetical protein
MQAPMRVEQKGGRKDEGEWWQQVKEEVEVEDSCWRWSWSWSWSWRWRWRCRCRGAEVQRCSDSFESSNDRKNANRKATLVTSQSLSVTSVTSRGPASLPAELSPLPSAKKKLISNKLLLCTGIFRLFYC